MNHKSRILSLILLPVLGLTLAAQTFDERMSDWPLDHKINGSIVATGDLDPSKEILDLFLQLAGDDKAKIVVIGSAPGMTGVEIENRPWDQVASYDRVRLLILIGRSAKDSELREVESSISDAISDASGVWIQTGRDDLAFENQEILIQVADGLRDVIDRKGVIFASGRAAAMLGPLDLNVYRMHGEQNMPMVKRGMNLFPSAIIATDFDQQRRNAILSALASNPRSVGIGIEKGTAIVLRGRAIRAVGKGHATFMLMANERRPLRVQSIKQAPGRRANPYDYLVDLTAWRRDAIDRTIETFPPLEPQTPNVPNGTLMMVGGGGLPEGLMDKFVEMAGGVEARLIYVPCTPRDEISRRDNRLIEAWNQLGVSAADVLHTKDRNKAHTDESFLEPLKTATGIWFGGGRQWNFSDSYYGTEAHRLMKKVLERGGVIAGSSAGATVQARYLARANPLGNFDIMAPGYERGGLGFISGVAIDQHFTQRGRQKDMTQLVNRYPQLLGIGLDEGTALIVQQSVGEVVGSGRVFFYDRAQHAAWDDPDYLALPAGSKYDLAKRRAIESAIQEADDE